MKNPSAILTADWHIRATKPRCRTDNFTAVMWSKIQFILALADEYDIPIILAGDLGEHSQWPNWLIETFIRIVSEYEVRILAIPGQHDLPEHNLDLIRKSAFGVLIQSETIIPITYSEEKGDSFEKMYNDINPHSTPKQFRPFNIGITHRMVIENKPEWPGQIASSAMTLIKRYPQYKIILSGDNHKPFVVKYRGRILVNPGSMVRSTAGQMDHRPRVYLWREADNEVEAVYLPIEDGVIDRSHIDTPQERDNRIEAYTTRLSEKYEIGMSFKKNLEAHFKANRTRIQIKERTWEACEQ